MNTEQRERLLRLCEEVDSQKAYSAFREDAIQELIAAVREVAKPIDRSSFPQCPVCGMRVHPRGKTNHYRAHFRDGCMSYGLNHETDTWEYKPLYTMLKEAQS